MTLKGSKDESDYVDMMPVNKALKQALFKPQLTNCLNGNTTE